VLSRVYVETTIVSYLTAWPSRDVVIAGHQQVTKEWWETRQGDFELCVSQLVLDEASMGDEAAARERIEVLRSLILIETLPEAVALVKALLFAGALPNKAAADALHIAVAATHGIPYLLTWNCRHLANAATRRVIESTCQASGFKAPIICTPDELLER
jgi:predicted nucleic acid-binding protein